MKVGTDGVLLGAWCPLNHHPESILDVGTGTGLIALMMAQRSEAFTIDALELDEQAYEQAVENFEQSDWGDRLFCYHSSFQEFVREMTEDGEKYDLIISNPPFYTDEFETVDRARNKARFASSLPFKELIAGVKNLLSPAGTFVTIIPYREEEDFVAHCLNNTLRLAKICRVKGTPESPFKRSLLEFSFEQQDTEEEELTIELARHQYTKEYVNLTGDFYLKM